jgi:recombination protein RecT
LKNSVLLARRSDGSVAGRYRSALDRHQPFAANARRAAWTLMAQDVFVLAHWRDRPICRALCAILIARMPE